MALYERKDVWSLGGDDPIVVGYRNAVKAMKALPATDPSSWSYQAAMHGSYVKPPKDLWNQCRHQSWWFLSWHRMYVFYFERIVRQCVRESGGPRDWALPYWNYDRGGDTNQIPRPFRDPKLSNGDDNPLYVSQRGAGINAGAGLPPKAISAKEALARPLFTGDGEFGGGRSSVAQHFAGHTGLLEFQPHNVVHSMVGGGPDGWMSDPNTAAQDPIFWLHHANIDRLWWVWQQIDDARLNEPSDGGWRDQPFAFFDVAETRVQRKDSDAMNVETQLGYTYIDPSTISFAATPRPAGVSWPAPWPSPRVAASAGAAEHGAVTRELVGATEEPVRLTGQAAQADVRIDTRALASLAGREYQHRAFLAIDNVDVETDPGAVYDIFVNLATEADAATEAAHHVGVLSFFGVERSRDPSGDEHAHGFHVSLEITEQLDRSASDGSWPDGERIAVAFRPLGLLPPPGGTAPAVPAHEDNPVTIGRLSVHVA